MHEKSISGNAPVTIEIYVSRKMQKRRKSVTLACGPADRASCCCGQLTIPTSSQADGLALGEAPVEGFRFMPRAAVVSSPSPPLSGGWLGSRGSSSGGLPVPLCKGQLL